MHLYFIITPQRTFCFRLIGRRGLRSGRTIRPLPLLNGLMFVRFDVSFLNSLIVSFPAMTDDPRFAEPIPNVTVALGRDASLPCVVENLGKYKVWFQVVRIVCVSL